MSISVLYIRSITVLFITPPTRVLSSLSPPLSLSSLSLPHVPRHLTKASYPVVRESYFGYNPSQEKVNNYQTRGLGAMSCELETLGSHIRVSNMYKSAVMVSLYYPRSEHQRESSVLVIRDSRFRPHSCVIYALHSVR